MGVKCGMSVTQQRGQPSRVRGELKVINAVVATSNYPMSDVPTIATTSRLASLEVVSQAERCDSVRRALGRARDDPGASVKVTGSMFGVIK